MSKNLRTNDYLKHMADAIKRIAEYVEDIDELGFLKSTIVQDAVIRNIEVIGEASRNIIRHDPEFAEKYPELPLFFAYEMRNFLTHGYFKIDLEIVWKTIENDLPILYKQISNILEK